MKEAEMQILRGDCRGITLVEVMITMAIVAFVTIALLATITQNVFFAGKADDIYKASMYAQRRMDVIKKFDFSEVAAVAPETETAIDEDGDGTSDFFRSTQVTTNYDSRSDLLKVKVSVYRAKDGVKTGGAVIMETLIVDHGG